LNHAILIFLGSGLGGLCRYWVSNGVYFLLGRVFPYGTLVVNISGCLLMGFFFSLIIERMGTLGIALRSLVLIGFLGGYTTFSAFSIETMTLFENGALFSAGLNIILSLTLCIIATWLGTLGGRLL
jgi:fluoride exporter